MSKEITNLPATLSKMPPQNWAKSSISRQDPVFIQLLKLQDLILIENAEIEFSGGLNIFTGETGSGKSAILTAIRLVAGERADAEWIRSGAAIGIAEVKLASFPKELLGEIDPPPPWRTSYGPPRNPSFREKSLFH